MAILFSVTITFVLPLGLDMRYQYENEVEDLSDEEDRGMVLGGSDLSNAEDRGIVSWGA